MEEETLADQQPVELVCPECEAEGKHTVFDEPRYLGRHRRFRHGVLGKRAQAQAESGMNPRRRRRSGTNKPLQPVPREEEPEGGPTPFPMAMIGYAIGKLESLAEQIARENGFSPKEFAPLVMDYYSQVAKR